MAQPKRVRVNPAYCQGATCSCAAGVVADLNAAFTCAASGDRIVYECDAVKAGRKCFEAPLNYSGTLTNLTLVADPAHGVEFRPLDPLPVDTSASIGFALALGSGATGWTFDGFDFNGRGAELFKQGYTNPLELVIITADYVTIKNARVFDAMRNLIAVRRGTAPKNVLGFTLENSVVYDCIAWDQLTALDCNGVYTTTAEKMVIRDNIIHHCSGDPIQLDVEVTNGQYDPGTGWADVLISGNTLYTAPDARLLDSNGEPHSPGEEGIDVKPGRGGARIVANNIKGFRGWDNTAQVGRGTGGGGSLGACITVHGSSTNCGSAQTYPFCVEIEGNDVSDCNTGIAVSNNALIGSAAHDVTIHHNIIHDLSGDMPQNAADPNQRGAAFRFTNAVGASYGATYNLTVESNTVSNTPGKAVFQAGDAPTGTNSLRYNVFSHAGRFEGTGVTDCTASNATGFNTSSGSNMCWPEQGAAICSAGHTVSNVQYVAEGTHPTTCGDDPKNRTTAVNYALLSTSPAIDTAGTALASMTCGKARDFGAREFCDNDSTWNNGRPRFSLNTTTNGTTVLASDYYRLTAAFTSGIGAYANAMTFYDPPLPNARCAHASPALEGCLLYTRSCSSECTPTLSPNGELNCACIKPEQRSVNIFAKAKNTPFVTQLNVDWPSTGYGNIDEVRDDTASREFKAMGEPYEGRLGWEDLHTSLMAGDRDDYIASARIVTCNQKGRGLVTGFMETGSPACPSTCSNCSSAPSTPLRAKAKLWADSGEGMQEPKQIHLSVTVYSDDATTQRFAVCPTLKLKSATGTGFERITYQGGGTCGSAQTTNFGQPACPGAAVAGGTGVGLARYQSWTSSCAPQSNADDADALEPARSCGDAQLPGTKTFTYQIPTEQLDQLYRNGYPTGATAPPSQSTVAELRDHYYEGIDVYIVTDLKARQFFCPSGVGITMGGVDPDIGTLRVRAFPPAEVPLEPR